MIRGPGELAPGVHATRLPGGPSVLTEVVDGVRSVTVGIWLRQGRAHEEPGRVGASHLLEHAVFKGAGGRDGREIARAVESVGGELDAYTTQEHTAYHARASADHLGLALGVLSDLVYRPELDAGAVAAEREVVLEELAGAQDDPGDAVFRELEALLYPEHPYGADVLGTAESVAGLDAAALRAVADASYRPANAVVAAAGRLDHREVVERVRECLPRETSGADGPAEGAPPGEGEDSNSASGSRGRVDPAEGRGRLDPGPREVPGLAPSDPATRRLGHPGLRRVHLAVGARTVPVGDPLRRAVALVDTALGGGMSSRLFQRVREDLGLAYDVFSFHTFHSAAGHAGAYLATRPANAAAAREALLEELRRIAEAGLALDELDAAKEELKGRWALGLEGSAARASRLAGLALNGERYRTLDELARGLDRVTADQAARAADLLHPDRLSVVELEPAGDEGAGPVRGEGETRTAAEEKRR